MSTADFRHIAFGEGRRNCERLFRAAISAFCTLARPTRNEIAQLDDLALGLFDAVGADARRFAAAALCECDPAPKGLLHRLAHEPVSISAPLLIRSKALSDVDLIALIARHGLAHARAIARRDNLHPAIAALVRALEARAESDGVKAPLEAVRRQLRALMQPTRDEDEAAEPLSTVEPDGEHPARQEDRYAILRGPALSGDTGAFAAALARLLEIAPERARRVAAGITYSELMSGLKALDLSCEQAFLLTAALFPAQLAPRAAIRLFVERYEATGEAEVRHMIETWRHADGTPNGRPEGASYVSLASVR